MSVRPAAIDPPQVAAQLWAGFGGEVGWDVGANCGQSVPHMCAAFERITCFEPAFESYEFMKRIYGRVSNIDLQRVALSDVDGTVELAVLPDQIATGQLVTPGTHGMEWDPQGGWGGVEHRVVQSRTADSWAREHERPDFIKVDTEGHEHRVLKGAQGLLRLGQTDWLIEFHSRELYKACRLELQGAGYRAEIVRHPHYPEGSKLYYGHGWLRAHAPGRLPVA